MPTFGDRLRHAWNAFLDRNMVANYYNIGAGNSGRPDKSRRNIGTERSIVSAVYNRIALDAATTGLHHVRVDQNERYLETLDTGLNTCLSLQANIDQSGRSFIQDVILSMFDEGCVAVVPVDTTLSPSISSSYDILSLRTGKILEWYPYHVRLNVYNEKRGMREDIMLPKKDAAIIENPFYAVMNEPSSTLQRLIYKLNLLDAIDQQSGSGKLDIIIQLPYVIKTEARKKQAEIRRKDIEEQLSGSVYGIAYVDGTEKVTQLNRPAENNLMAQIEYLASMLYSQLSISEEILNGTADEKSMQNYQVRTIEPILDAIIDAVKPKFLTKTGRSQGQSIMYFKDPFKYVLAADIGPIADSLTRNAILTSNEIRSIIGFKPSVDKEADTLRNKNLNPAADTTNKPELPPGKTDPNKEGVTVDDGTTV